MYFGLSHSQSSPVAACDVVTVQNAENGGWAEESTVEEGLDDIPPQPNGASPLPPQPKRSAPAGQQVPGCPKLAPALGMQPPIG